MKNDTINLQALAFISCLKFSEQLDIHGEDEAELCINNVLDFVHKNSKIDPAAWMIPSIVRLSAESSMALAHSDGILTPEVIKQVRNVEGTVKWDLSFDFKEAWVEDRFGVVHTTIPLLKFDNSEIRNNA